MTIHELTDTTLGNDLVAREKAGVNVRTGKSGSASFTWTVGSGGSGGGNTVTVTNPGSQSTAAQLLGPPVNPARGRGGAALAPATGRSPCQRAT